LPLPANLRLSRRDGVFIRQIFESFSRFRVEYSRRQLMNPRFLAGALLGAALAFAQPLAKANPGAGGGHAGFAGGVAAGGHASGGIHGAFVGGFHGATGGFHAAYAGGFHGSYGGGFRGGTYGSPGFAFGGYHRFGYSPNVSVIYYGGYPYTYYTFPDYNPGYDYYDNGDASAADNAPAAPSVSNDGAAVTSEAQQALAHAGYYSGPIDGNLGPVTQAAIQAYQRDHNLPVTGAVDGALISALGLD
jgi:hypothetical protein